MAKYNTRNPVGSTDPRDLYDNASNLDELVNGEKPFVEDRLGKQRESWSGMEYNHQVAQAGREEAFQAAQADKEDRFQQFLLSSGYVSLGNYEAGITFEARNQYVVYEGQFYRPAAATALPYTTNGDWEVDGPAMVLLGDEVLRQELGGDPAKGQGAAMVRGTVIYVDSIADLQSLDTIGLVDGQIVDVQGSRFRRDDGSWSPLEFVDAAIFGLSPHNTPEQNSDALDEALSFCSGKCSLYIRPELHYVARTIELPSNTEIFSDGKEHIVFKMDSAVRRGELLMVTGHRGVHKENIVIRSMGLDFNRERWENADSSSVYIEATPSSLPLEERNSSPLSESCLVICNSSNVLVQDVKAIDSFSHCIDITAPSEGRGLGSAVWYDPEPSFNVTVQDVVVSGHGDDGVTTHQAHDVFIDRVESLGASGVKVQVNANAVEIDDGSRHIRIGTVTGRKCTHALSVQAHADSPAPYAVVVDTVIAINCNMGVILTHTGFSGEEGLSPTARDVTIGTILCVAPHRTDFYGVVMEARGALAVSAYEGVSVGTIQLDDGTSHLASTIDGVLPTTPTDTTSPRLITTYGGNVRGLSIGTVIINGFRDTEFGVYLAPRYGGAVVDRLISRNGPKCVFRDQSIPEYGGFVSLNYYQIEGDHLGEGTPAIEYNPVQGSVVGDGMVSGYDFAVKPRGGVGSATPYSIVDGSRDTRVASNGELTRRTWVGSSVRSTEWISGLAVNMGSAGGNFAFHHTAGTDTSNLLASLSPTTLRAGTDNTLSLGLAGFRWSEVFASTGTISTSDEREKEQVRPLSEAERSAAIELKGMLCAFKWKEAVQRKGSDARWHFGVMAQEVAEVFERHGLDAHDYGLFCYDEWEAEYDDDGEIMVEAGNRYGVRYDQLLAFIISAL